MKKYTLTIGLIALAAIFLTSCGQQGANVPEIAPNIATVTLQPTETSTATPSPTSTAIPTPTQTPIPAQVIISPENVAQLRKISQLGAKTIYQSAYSPDGQTFAVATSSGIDLYRSSDLQQIAFFASDYAARSLAFSPDGQTIAAGCSDNAVRIWQVSSGNLLKTMASIPDHAGHSDFVTSVNFSPDGLYLVSGSWWGTINLWNVNTEEIISTQKVTSGGIRIIKFSPAGHVIASSGYENQLRLWQVTNGELERINTIYVGTDNNSGIYSFDFSPDSETIVSGSEDGFLYLWQVNSGQLIKKFGKNEGGIRAVAFSPDSQTIVSVSSQGSIQLWQVSDFKLLADANSSISEKYNPISTIFYSPDGTTIALGNFSTIVFVQLPDLKSLPGVIAYEPAVNSIAFSPDSMLLALGHLDGSVSLWQIDGNTRQLFTAKKHSENISSLAFSPDGQKLVSASWDKTLYLWQVSDGTLLATMKGHQREVSSVAFSPDGQTIASASWDGTIKLWNGNNGTFLTTFKNHNSIVTGVAFSPDGQTLASSHGAGPYGFGGRQIGDNSVRLWQLSNKEVLKTLKGHEWGVQNVSFSPIEQSILSTGLNGQIIIWEKIGGPPKQFLSTGDISFTTSVFSSQGNMIAACGYQNIIRFWNYDSGKKIIDIPVNSPIIWNILFSPNGKLLALVTFEGDVYLLGIP